MFISKARHQEACKRYDRLIYELTDRLSQLDCSHDSDAGPYKSIQECREVAKVVSTLPPEQSRIILYRLALIDSWLTRLLPLMTTHMGSDRRDAWDRALRDLPVGEIYGEAWQDQQLLNGSHRFVR